MGLPDDHPWNGIDFADLDILATARSIDVHGGITWNGHCDELRPCELSRHWLGFDCWHTGTSDLVLSPGAQYRIARLHRNVYRDLAYARRELEKLAEQASRTPLLS